MKLLIDIGNTAVKIMSFENESLSFVTRFYLKDLSRDKLDSELHGLNNVDGVVVSSVVPNINSQFDNYFKSKCNLLPQYIQIGDYKDITIKIDNPKELGIDLYCDIVAGLDYAHKEHKPVLVVDLGTASKILVVNENNEFKSCAILPGINMCKRMLSSSTALLPEADQKEIKKVTEATNTIDVINSSVYYGHVEMINGLINRIEEETQQKYLYIITGGNAEFIYKDLKQPNLYKPFLCFEGMKKIIDLKE